MSSSSRQHLRDEVQVPAFVAAAAEREVERRSGSRAARRSASERRRAGLRSRPSIAAFASPSARPMSLRASGARRLDRLPDLERAPSASRGRAARPRRGPSSVGDRRRWPRSPWPRSRRPRRERGSRRRSLRRLRRSRAGARPRSTAPLPAIARFSDSAPPAIGIVTMLVERVERQRSRPCTSWPSTSASGPVRSTLVERAPAAGRRHRPGTGRRHRGARGSPRSDCLPRSGQRTGRRPRHAPTFGL